MFFGFWFFGPEACGILAPRPGIEPVSPALEGGFLTTGPSEKSLEIHFSLAWFVMHDLLFGGASFSRNFNVLSLFYAYFYRGNCGH